MSMMFGYFILIIFQILQFYFPQGEITSQVCFPHCAHFWLTGADAFSAICHGHCGAELKVFGAFSPFTWGIASTVLGIVSVKGQTITHLAVSSETSPQPHVPHKDYGLPHHKAAFGESIIFFSIVLHPACLEDILLCVRAIRDSEAKAMFCQPALLL